MPIRQEGFFFGIHPWKILKIHTFNCLLNRTTLRFDILHYAQTSAFWYTESWYFRILNCACVWIQNQTASKNEAETKNDVFVDYSPVYPCTWEAEVYAQIMNESHFNKFSHPRTQLCNTYINTGCLFLDV